MYLLKLALRPWRLAPYSQTFSAIAVGLLLVLGGSMYWLQQGLRPVVVQMQREQVLTVYLDPSVEKKDEAQVVDSIRVVVGAKAVREIQFVGSQDFISHLKGSYPGLSEELENLGSETESIIPRYVSVSGVIPAGVVEEVKAVRGVESVDSAKDRYQHVVGVVQALRWVLRFLLIGLGLALLTGLIHLSRTNSYLNGEAVNLLRLMGADALRTRGPGVISGLSVGFVGGVIAFGAWISVVAWLIGEARSIWPILANMPAASFQIGFYLLMVGTGLGAVSGLFEHRG